MSDPETIVVSTGEARGRVEAELAKRTTTVYETVPVPDCDREGCPEACDGSCRCSVAGCNNLDGYSCDANGCPNGDEA